MKYKSLISPSEKSLTAIINTDNGQLVGLLQPSDALDYMHGGGRSEDDYKRNTAGWPNSEILMFPIVSASKGNKIVFEGNKYDLDQHGIVRAIKPSISSPQDKNDTMDLSYDYESSQPVDNSIRNKKSAESPKTMALPFSFRFTKSHTVNDALNTVLTIENTSDAAFSYALGWHPAFNPLGNSNEGFFFDAAGNRLMCLDSLVGFTKRDGGLEIFYDGIKYINEKTGEGFKLKSDLGHLMLWAPTTDLFCIEPITEKKEKGTQIDLTPGKSYKNVMMSGHKKTYHVEITPL